MAKATPFRSGDELAGVAATSAQERVAAQYVRSEVPLPDLLAQPLIPYEEDEITRLIVDSHDAAAFAPIAHHSVGGFREHLLDYGTSTKTLRKLAPGITPEMAAAVSKLMRNQDLISMTKKCQVSTAFRNTIGLPGHLSLPNPAS
jgi:ethanolamine ammonia-lyase large subunit